MFWSIHRWLFLFTMSIMALKECQSFFLRHNQTGRCIAKGRLVYHSTTWAIPFYAEMTNKCFDDEAKFRYVGEQLRHNGGTFFAPNSGYIGRVLLYEGISQQAKKNQYSSKQNLRQTDDGYLFFYNAHPSGLCAKPETVYVMREKNCNSPQQLAFTFGDVTDYNKKMESVGCSAIQRMKVQRADYGDFIKNHTFDINGKTDEICSILTNCLVKSLCGGKESCGLTFNNYLLPKQYCSNHSKEIYTEYTCVDFLNSNIITGKGPNVRLSESPNKGYIEVKNGSTWAIVDEKRWDKNRQKMLCQHLKFNETEKNDIVHKPIGSGKEIVSGDLICYSTQPNATSCCKYLETLMSTESTDVPHVTCGKICENPILENLPNTAFSGSGGSSGYEQASFYKDGWCSTGAGGEYILIDFQKEYHVTRIVTMGDKNQTVWSESYAMSYSHNSSVDQNSTQVLGNENAYQASTTLVDIYNVRRIKIRSKGNTSFCLRIELCGKVQLPASVQAFDARPSNFSVDLSWTIPSWKISSYITRFLIFLNDTLHKNISRQEYGNQFTINGLKPNTIYTVGIETQDGNWNKGKRKSRQFSTKEAVPNGPPVDVSFQSRGKNSLSISWKAPKRSERNGVLTGYQVCFYADKDDKNHRECRETTSEKFDFKIDGLKPSTKYFVTVAARTKIGYGNKSSEIYKITNGDSVNPVVMSYSSIRLNISKPAGYVKEVIVIVKNGISSETASEDIKTGELKPYSKETQNPYITAYFKLDTKNYVNFVIGEGDEYEFRNKTYGNQLLKQNSNYVIFLRFFESEDSFFSTEWSSNVTTMKKPHAPKISIMSSGIKNYNISWHLPPLPEKQSVLQYHTTYVLPNGSRIQRNVSHETTFFNFTVDIETRYTFAVQVETQAGRSDITSETWWSQSVPLKSPKKTESGYAVELRKPRDEQNIKKIALVILQSKSGDPPSPENLKVLDSPPKSAGGNTDIAFIAGTFTIADFESNELEILLREPNKRRKKRAVDVRVSLIPNATYRTAQRNEDNMGKFSWSYWSEQFAYVKVTDPTTTIVTSTKTSTPGKINIPKERIDDNGDWIIVGASAATVVIVVVSVLAAIFFRKWRALEHRLRNNNVDNFHEMKGIEHRCNCQDNGKMEELPANESIYVNETAQESTYMSLKENREPENVYQSLQSPSTSANPHCAAKEDGDQSSIYMSLE